jgi:uncharacterized delta-60 repeat protein
MDGSLDTPFDTDGKVVTALDATDTLNNMVVSADGKIIVTGTDGNHDIIVMRFNSNGKVDTTFSADGKVTTD